MSEKTYQFNGEGKEWAKDWLNMLTEMVKDVPVKDNDPRWKEKSDTYCNKLTSSLVGREVNTEERVFYLKRTIAIGCIDKFTKMLELPEECRTFLPEPMKDMFLCKDYMISLLTRMRNVVISELKEKELWINKVDNGTE